MTEEQQVLSDAVDVLVQRHGGLRKAARAIEVNYAYLSRLWNGLKSNPTDEVLRKLNLERKVSFEPRRKK